MNKSFPTVSLYRPLRWLGIAGAAALTGCVGYYPDSYPSSPQPYYSGGGGTYYEPYDSGYYSSPGYYGPAYGPTTIYYQSYSPGYYYRPGYGYYPPPPRPSRPPGGGYNHGPSHSDNVKGAWADRLDNTTGNNPGRYPHDRGDDRNDGRPSPSNDARGGWGGRVGQSGGDRSPPPRPMQQAPQQQQAPARNDDRDGARGAWGNRIRDKSN